MDDVKGKLHVIWQDIDLGEIEPRETWLANVDGIMFAEIHMRLSAQLAFYEFLELREKST